MEVKATAKYMRISAQKVRKIVGAIKGKPAEAGINALKFMPQKSAGLVEKILRSAIANADQNAKMDVDSLVIKNIIVNEGPTLKRFRARARGRASRILKRTSHITVIVSER
ncbi:MAG: 50S ribosomal protein L22 [Desulfosalsimonadaceae bacterium]|nr:50S ribosomal protein L22 [Desulfosalsimonadaceae bacterium]